MESRSTSVKFIPSRSPAALMSSMDITSVAMASDSLSGRTETAPPPKEEREAEKDERELSLALCELGFCVLEWQERE